jgi:hypothetical protein
MRQRAPLSLLLPLLLLLPTPVQAHDPHDPHDPGVPWLIVDKFDQGDPFRQLEEILPTPTEARLASGAPGPGYWQNRADHRIEVTLDADAHRIIGSEWIDYHNHSPHELTYLWLQLDQNRFREDSPGRMTQTEDSLEEGRSFGWLRRLATERTFDGGCNITLVTDEAGADLPHTIVHTMMRIDLPAPLPPGGRFKFRVDWNHSIVNADVIRARGGYEWFEEAGNAIYEIAQWFPRMCAYTDVDGWQNKQFIGSGEFTLEFGDYEVEITVPSNFVVAASGELLNPEQVLTETQRERFGRAKTAATPLFVITPDEALANEGTEADGSRTWIYRAENVRDFAFAASEKFIWDAWGVPIEGGPSEPVMAMSYYPQEGEPLWSRYSTQAIAHTLEMFSKHTIPYPYPVSISVNGPVGGMEYPMICFNGPRPEPDGTYTPRTKYGLIGVIIHEVGHNWFPMIINSDERQWTWMDEGLNTFVQFLTEQTWEDAYPSRRGEPENIVEYLKSARQVPIMTNSESIQQFGRNAYAKPATAMNILRESILGRELFDFAFAEYSRRWAFKRPQPADLFRTLEDASGLDLDWFWRGWFYSTDHCDIAIDRVVHYTLRTRDPDIDKGYDRERRDAAPESLSKILNRDVPKRTDRFPELLDFYNSFDDLEVTDEDRRAYDRFLARLSEGDRELLAVPWNFYALRFRNIGGLVMPLVVRITYESGRVEDLRIPAEIWRRDDTLVTRLLVTEEPIASLLLDPHAETADADRHNNHFPSTMERETFTIEERPTRDNPMQIALRSKQRSETETAAKKLGERLYAEWKRSPGEDAPPADAEGDLLRAAESERLLADPWGNRFKIVFSAAPVGEGEESETRFALIRCDGPDQEAATRDDLRFVVYRDGRVEPTSRGDEEPESD